MSFWRAAASECLHHWAICILLSFLERKSTTVSGEQTMYKLYLSLVSSIPFIQSACASPHDGWRYNNSYKQLTQHVFPFLFLSCTLRLDEQPGSPWTPQLTPFQFQTLLQNLSTVLIRATFGENGEKSPKTVGMEHRLNFILIGGCLPRTRLPGQRAADISPTRGGHTCPLGPDLQLPSWV